MKITPRTARYIHCVMQAVDTNRLRTVDLPDSCSECGLIVANGFGGDSEAADIHVWAQTPDGEEFVVVGCEGYWHINPELVGVKSINWMPTPNPDDALARAGVHDFIIGLDGTPTALGNYLAGAVDTTSLDDARATLADVQTAIRRATDRGVVVLDGVDPTTEPQSPRTAALVDLVKSGQTRLIELLEVENALRGLLH